MARQIEKGTIDSHNASSVPPEWHGWLHHATDDRGLKAAKTPVVQVAFVPHGYVTGTKDMYVPKGHFLNGGGIKNWKRYTPWSPP